MDCWDRLLGLMAVKLSLNMVLTLFINWFLLNVLSGPGSPRGAMKTKITLTSDVQKNLQGEDVRGDNSDSIHATSWEEKTPMDIHSGISKCLKVFLMPKKTFLSPDTAQTIVSTHGSCLQCRWLPVCSCSWPLCVNALGKLLVIHTYGI